MPAAAAGWSSIDHRVMFDDVEKMSFFGLGTPKHAQHRVVTTTKRHKNTLLTQTNPSSVRNEDRLPRRSAATIRQVLCTRTIPGGGCVIWVAVAPEKDQKPLTNSPSCTMTRRTGQIWGCGQSHRPIHPHPRVPSCSPCSWLQYDSPYDV